MMTERRGMKHGLYVLRWVDGGASLASVGHDDGGRNWFAPTNWIARPGMLSMPSFDWISVASVEPILLERDWREQATETENPPADLRARTLAALDLLGRVRFRAGTEPAGADSAYAAWSDCDATSRGLFDICWKNLSEVTGLVRAGVLVPEEP